MDIFSFVFLLGYGFVVYLLPWFVFFFFFAWMCNCLNGR